MSTPSVLVALLGVLVTSELVDGDASAVTPLPGLLSLVLLALSCASIARRSAATLA